MGKENKCSCPPPCWCGASYKTHNLSSQSRIWLPRALKMLCIFFFFVVAWNCWILIMSIFLSNHVTCDIVYIEHKNLFETTFGQWFDTETLLLIGAVSLFLFQLYRLERYDDCKSVYTDLIRNSQDEYEEERKTNLAAVVASMSQWEEAPLVSTPKNILILGSLKPPCCSLLAFLCCWSGLCFNLETG